ncbi:MAG TPA: SDR family NAD(P)-dependent oxidoreductase, partial [Victivallales bacterium]|nr:SDR family NAD(P)-dependent oxidoreductase [Victivallales bacterium]
MIKKNKNTERVALITGGAQGIGRGIAEKFLSKKIKVFIADIDNDAGKELEEREDLFFIHCDVRKEEDVINTISSIKTKIAYLDILVNNAGLAVG